MLGTLPHEDPGVWGYGGPHRVERSGDRRRGHGWATGTGASRTSCPRSRPLCCAWPSCSPATTVAGAPDVPALPASDAGPTRGSLAGDAGFVAAVRQLSWSDPGARAAAPPPAGSQVLFAGDVPGGRWALVSRRLTVPPPLVDDDELERELGTGSVALAWFAGPPGAAPDQLRLESAPVVVDPGLPAALWDPATGTLAVVAPSPAVTARPVDGNGTPLAELPLDDGLAVRAVPQGTATVEVLAADGTVLASVEPLPRRGG